MASVNMRSVKAFDIDLRKFSQAIGVEVGLVTKRTVFGLYRRITQLTPVRTGRARASWGISVGSVPNDPGEPPTKGKVPLSRQRTRIKTGDFGSPYAIWYIYNNLPYIEPLETGSSKQAPAGMVAVSLAEAEADLLFDLSIRGV